MVNRCTRWSWYWLHVDCTENSTTSLELVSLSKWHPGRVAGVVRRAYNRGFLEYGGRQRPTSVFAIVFQEQSFGKRFFHHSPVHRIDRRRKVGRVDELRVAVGGPRCSNHRLRPTHSVGGSEAIFLKSNGDMRDGGGKS